MPSSKKGEVKWEIVTIVPLAIAAFLFFSHITSINAFAKDKTDIETCRLSVVASSIHFAYGVDAWGVEWFKASAPNPFYIDCGKRESFIRKDSIKSSGFETKLSQDQDQREIQLKDFVLNEMASCWRSFGDASDNIYTAGVGEHESISLDDSACFYCSETFIENDFFVDSETKEAKTFTLRDFYNYANDKRRVIDGKSYVEYLTGGTDMDAVPPEKDLILDSSHLQWSTVFVIKRIDNHFLEGGGLWEWIPIPFKGAVRSIGREVKAATALPIAGSAIVDCYLVVEDDEGTIGVAQHKDKAVGCDENFEGLIFGKVGAGYDKRSLSLLNPIIRGRNPVERDAARFPMTVRFVPTEEVFRIKQCQKLY